MLLIRTILSSVLVACSVVFATDDFRYWSTSSGLTAFSFLKNYQSPRSEALSNAGASLPTTDPFIVLLNPASLQPSQFRHHIALSWSVNALERNEGMLAWNTRIGWALVQSTFLWTNHESIDGTDVDPSGAPYVTGNVYNPLSQVWMVSAVVPTRHFRLGGNLKLVRDQLSKDAGDQSAMAFAFDWGLKIREINPRFGMSLSVLDVGRQIRVYTENGVNDCPLDTRIRASGYYRPAQLRGLTIALDGDLPRYTPPLAHVGIEYTLNHWLQLRAGTQTTMAQIGDQVNKLVSDSTSNSTTSSPLLTLASFGAGFIWKDFTIDYSCTLLRYSLEQDHRLALRTGF